jgi:LCP family protein required for cell wall assembly
VPSRSSLSKFPGRFALALALVLTIVAGTFVLVSVLIEVKLGKASRVDLTLAEAPDGGGSNYLLIGSDTRKFLENSVEQEAFGDESDTGPQRSDTIMVLHTDPDSGRALLVSFPRDLWVDIPGEGGSRINAAFNDGPQKVIDTLAANFDVPIHHYVEVNFGTFEDIVNAIGSVPVYFPAAARDKLSNLGVPFPGCVPVDGPTGLAFVRSRHLELLNPDTHEWQDADEIPDLGRIGRQQAFLREVGTRAMDTALSNPFKANEIADSAVKNLTLDQDFGRTDVFALADGLAGSTDGIGGPESQTIPTEPKTRDGQEVLDATADADALVQRLRDFELTVPDPDDVAPEDVSVRVLNASGQDGAAGEALDALTQNGFEGAGTDTSAQPFQTSEVRFVAGDEAAAALVASFVMGPVQIVEDDSIPGGDVTLYIGRAFSGIGAAPVPVSESPSPAVSLAPVPGGC